MYSNVCTGFKLIFEYKLTMYNSPLLMIDNDNTTVHIVLSKHENKTFWRFGCSSHQKNYFRCSDIVESSASVPSKHVFKTLL